MDITYYIDENDGMLYKSVENDGATFIRRGPEGQLINLGPVYEAVRKHPNELEKALRIKYYAVCKQAQTV